MNTALTKRETLAPVERKQLSECVNTINRAVNWLEGAADAFATIRDQRLYRAEAKTFEEFCQSRWKFSRQHVNNLIRFTETRRDLETLASKSLPAPESERQVRPIAALPAPQQAKAWELAVQHAGGGQPTGKQVARAAQIVTGKPAAAAPVPTPLSLVTPTLDELRRMPAGHVNEKAALEILLAEVQRRLSQCN